MKSSFCIDLQRFMLIPTKFPLSLNISLSYYLFSMLYNYHIKMSINTKKEDITEVISSF